jgi:branched-chain amino acid transport system permease protein
MSIYVERWQTVMGVIFILCVLFARAGLYGSALALVRRRATHGPRVR